MKNLLTDAHTHSLASNKLSLLNYDWWKDSYPPDTPFFVGFHPWYLEKLPFNDPKEWLKRNLQHPQCLGLGEIGLDRACSTPLSEQIHWLEQQLSWAKDWNIPRISFHIVKAYSDIRPFLKNISSETKILWHDFNGNENDIQFLGQVKSFFSCGKRLLNPDSSIAKFFSSLPKDRILLESDEEEIEVLQELFNWVKAHGLSSLKVNENFSYFCR